MILTKIQSGKVRDMYPCPWNESFMIMKASDRVSAFDVVMPQTIPYKGQCLTDLSYIGFGLIKDIIPVHCDFLTNTIPIRYADENGDSFFNENCMVVRKLIPFKVEIIVRGYMAGSLWQQYQEDEPDEHKRKYKLYSKLDDAVITPTTKAPVGEHDEPITMTELYKMYGKADIDYIYMKASQMYDCLHNYALARGIKLLDTKFEFGYDENSGKIYVIDEVFTPDNSRFLFCGEHYDKQLLRNWLKDNWDFQGTPYLTNTIIKALEYKYQAIVEMLS